MINVFSWPQKKKKKKKKKKKNPHAIAGTYIGSLKSLHIFLCEHLYHMLVKLE